MTTDQCHGELPALHPKEGTASDDVRAAASQCPPTACVGLVVPWKVLTLNTNVKTWGAGSMEMADSPLRGPTESLRPGQQGPCQLFLIP